MVRICNNCNYFFPATMEEYTEFGICLNDKEFEPFLEELIDNSNYACCQSLVDRKKFIRDREACPDFSEIEEGFEIDEDSEFARELRSLMKSGQLNRETFEELLIMEQIRKIDFTTLPVDKHAENLRDPDPKVHEPLTRMLSEKRFSYRLKRKIEDILYQRDVETYRDIIDM